MRWWLNPFHLRDGIRGLRRIAAGGGPKSVRVAGIGHPEGWIVPTSEVKVEIETHSGSRVKLDPRVPIPFLYAWAYKLARRLDVPVVSWVEPGDVRFSLPLPLPNLKRV
jgi:hypothetical protein